MNPKNFSRQFVPLIASVFALLFVSLPTAAEDSVDAIVTVKAHTPVGKVNRKILGSNALGYMHSKPEYSDAGAGFWNARDKAPVPEMIQLARQGGVSSLRWPGGCDVHYFKWKSTVGPLAARPGQAFGLAEFLKVAESVGADPVITISDYSGDEQDAADLVEYLNAPVGSNPNGGIDWAAVRASQGHREPYGVKWFEFGNETDHGPHALNAPTNGTPMTAAEYSRRYRVYSKAMKAIDPAIQLGAVVAMDTSMPLSPWTEVLLKQAGPVADYLVYHAYLPRYSDNSGTDPIPRIFSVAFSGPKQIEKFIEDLRKETLRLAGRELPVAITEFNAQFVQDNPSPLRYSLGSAIVVADMVMTFLHPTNGVLFANYWAFANEYWGSIRGYAPTYLRRPAFHVFHAFNKYLGDSVLETEVTSSAYQSPGGFGVLPTGVTPQNFSTSRLSAYVPEWKILALPNVVAQADAAHGLSVTLPSSDDVNYHHASTRLSVEPNTGYRVSAEIRTTGFKKSGGRLEITDGRGWSATKSTAFSRSIRSSDWTPVTVDYVTLPDAMSVDIRLRRPGGSGDGGTMEIKNLQISRFTPPLQGSIPFVSALTTVRGKIVSIFLVNRDVKNPRKISIRGLTGVVNSAVTLSGPSLQSNNEVAEATVRPSKLNVGGLEAILLPPHSFSVISISASVANEK